ncbi:unnamed protein product, partial [marine sediment metagenome]
MNPSKGSERVVGYDPLEGEWLTWLPIWDSDLGALGAINLDAVIVNNEGEVYSWDTNTADFWHISLLGVITG